MALLDPDDFQPWLGRKVRVNTLPHPVELMLSRIDRRRSLPKHLDFREPFSLLFEAPLDVYLLDMSYEFDCGTGGPHQIFISQLPPSNGHRHYQAIFS